MRLRMVFGILGALAVVSGQASAAPVRAASALPAVSAKVPAMPRRAATPVERPSALAGVPILALAGLFGGVTVAALLVSGRGRSPG